MKNYNYADNTTLYSKCKLESDLRHFGLGQEVAC